MLTGLYFNRIVLSSSAYYYTLYEPLMSSIRNAKVAGSDSGTMVRVLQSPLSHGKLYGDDHPLVVKKRNKQSPVGRRIRKTGKHTSSKSKEGDTHRDMSTRSDSTRTHSKPRHDKIETGGQKSGKETLSSTQNSGQKPSLILHSQPQTSPSTLLPPVETTSSIHNITTARSSCTRNSGTTPVSGPQATKSRKTGFELEGNPSHLRRAWSTKSGVSMSVGGASEVKYNSQKTTRANSHSSFHLPGSRQSKATTSRVYTTDTSSASSVENFSRHWMSLQPKHSTKVKSWSRHNSVNKWRWKSGVSGGQNQLELQDLAEGLGHMSFRNVIVMSGAGISTPSGIPDFRTPGTGLYDNLQKYQLPEPSAVFDLTYFHRNPRPFFSLAKVLYPGSYCPSLAHCFVRLLQDKGVLLRHYTQNIDGLERLAGVDEGKLVEAHGSFSTASCTRCHTKQDSLVVKASIFQDEIPRCKYKYCKGVVKPDIVFFGEDLPKRFYSIQRRDFSKCDLLLVMGTSLQVEPFASLVTLPHHSIPRLLLNRETVGVFRSKRRRRTDVVVCSDVEESVSELAAGAGWDKDLNDIQREIAAKHSENGSHSAVRSTENNFSDADYSSSLTATMSGMYLQDTASAVGPTPPSSSSSPSSSPSSSSASILSSPSDD